MKATSTLLIMASLLCVGCSDSTSQPYRGASADPKGETVASGGKATSIDPADVGPPGPPGGGGGMGGFNPAGMFEESDKDGDGKLAGDEIEGWLKESASEYDSDGDGALTLEEFRSGMQQMLARGAGGPGGPMPAGPGGGGGGGGGGAGGGGPGGGGGGFDPEAIFKRRDADGDGKLAGDEIGERLRPNLDQVDADGDGAVTLEEFKSGMQKIFAGRGGGRGKSGDDSADEKPADDGDSEGADSEEEGSDPPKSPDGEK